MRWMAWRRGRRVTSLAVTLSLSLILTLTLTRTRTLTPQERILFMTTNHLELLDPALIRPGRVDVIHEISHASSSQCRRMFLKFFPERHALAESFVATAGHTKLSMALLQSFFMLYRHSAEEACLAANELCAGVDAHSAGKPVQQHMAENAMEKAPS